MAVISSFRATYYNTSVIGDLSLVICPPYDVISPNDAIHLKNKSPYNFSHLILPREKDDSYEWTKELLQKWYREKILIEDVRKFYYLYRQIFNFYGQSYSRDTIMVLVKLGKHAEVRPHENTHSVYKEDRLRILRKTRMNLSHVFAAIEDKEGFLNNLFESTLFEKPLLSAKSDDGIEHAVWRIRPNNNKKIEDFFSLYPLTILDGHHRYLSSVKFAEEEGALENEFPASFMLFAIANSYDSSLLVLPTHRAIKSYRKFKEDFEKYFDKKVISKDTLYNFVKNPSSSKPSFVLWYENELLFCEPKVSFSGTRLLEEIPTFWSDDILIDKCFGITSDERSKELLYSRDLDTLWLEKAKYGGIIFHAPLKVSLVIKVAEQGGFMPQKTTYFYPKLGAGLILRNIS